jgi:cell surface protein SprA
MSSVSINEQFSPLFDMDMNWKNGLTNRIEFKRSRNLGLTLSNKQLMEMRSKEFAIGVGYRFAQVPLTFITTGTGQIIKSDLNLKTDISFRDDITILRQIEGVENNALQQGKNSIKVSFSADYALSDKLNTRFFFDWMSDSPMISSFPTANTNVGISIRFTLSQ